jgi:hypothetical protein
MRSHANFWSAGFLLCFLCTAAPRYTFSLAGIDPGGWAEMLSSIGLTVGEISSADIVVVPPGAEVPSAEWAWGPRIERGTILILEGDSPLAQAFGFRANASPRVPTRSVEDLRAPELRIVWEQALDLPGFDIPQQARVFARERWQKTPLVAGFRRGLGAVLWVAAPPGNRGYERFPYLPQSLADLGLDPPFHAGNLWAFFDSAYRSRVDLDYFAARWRAAGIGALHVAAWHYWERDPQRDEYLRVLIDACHRHAIQVYAWMELPHVSDAFWDDHPQWREKTGLLQDARLDWRKLVNLTNRDAFTAVAAGVHDLLMRFDWDGVNLAELYFESLEGVDNPARFTPMNDDVRREFQANAGMDPRDLFDPQSPRHWTKDGGGLKRFLEFRVQLAERQQVEWIAQIQMVRHEKPYLDVTLTHIDDRFDTSMRDKLGADASRTLQLLAGKDVTFLIEDPATIWNLGPQRYPQIAARYTPLTPPEARGKLAIDINIVERYQDVYPTKQQTGAEMLDLVHTAARAFSRVALYFEYSISPHDLPLLASAAAGEAKGTLANGRLTIESPSNVGVSWNGPALVDGKPWPMASDTTVWLPRGRHTVTALPATSAWAASPLRIVDFNGELTMAATTPAGLEFAYQSGARAMAVLEHAPRKLAIDGVVQEPQLLGNVLLLPRGQHLVTLSADK